MRRMHRLQLAHCDSRPLPRFLELRSKFCESRVPWMDPHEGTTRIAKEYSWDVEIPNHVAEVRVGSALWVIISAIVHYKQRTGPR